MQGPTVPSAGSGTTPSSIVTAAKTASLFELVAARCWNVLNEGKSFTPVFVIGLFLLYHAAEWSQGGFWLHAGKALLWETPLFALLIRWDFPLWLRVFLLPPLSLFLWLFGVGDPKLTLFMIGLYLFFTVILWGTLYYHLRIGTPLTNFTRFWLLVLKNSDSTSANFFEQVPKSLLLVHVLEWLVGPTGIWGGDSAGPGLISGLGFGPSPQFSYTLFVALLGLYSWIIHITFFRWIPQEYEHRTPEPLTPPPPVKRAIVIVIDGCRRDRLEMAQTPFLDKLRRNGADFAAMETVYPARTVVCFSSMFTGTYPKEHGITSNLVLRHGIRCDSMFDTLRAAGKTGRLLGCAHLIDAFGDHVESFTAVMDNRVADRHILVRAREILQEQSPDLLVVQLIGVDQTGHSRGALYPEYLAKIAETDSLIAEFCGWLEQEGLWDGTLLVVMADHGQGPGIGGHGHLDVGERFVPFFIHGPGVSPGLVVGDRRSIVSLGPTLAWLLEAKVPSRSRAPVLVDAFTGGECG